MKIILFIGLICSSITAMSAKDISIQDRLYKLEKLVAGAENRGEIVMEMQKIQQQVDELNGKIEEQQYQIKTIKEKQKLLYIDIDSRLSDLESQGSSAANLPQQVQNLSSQDTTPAQVQTQQPPISEPIIDKPINNVEAAQNDYDVAFSHLRAGRFNESARLFETFIQMYPEHELIDNAYYWLGESFYVKRQYPQALSAFQTLVKQFPQSRKLADSMLKIGYTYFELDDMDKAKKNLSEVLKSFPNTSISRLAQNRLNQIKRGQ